MCLPQYNGSETKQELSAILKFLQCTIKLETFERLVYNIIQVKLSSLPRYWPEFNIFISSIFLAFGDYSQPSRHMPGSI